MLKILSQGAEATITQKGDKVYKERVAKSYRNEKIDTSLRKSRSKRELKVMKKVLELNINVPKTYEELAQDKYTIIMDYIDGKRLRDVLLEDPTKTKYLKQLGLWLAKMHDAQLIHGDLTTSNAMVDKNGEMFLIDFGLSFNSRKVEDMAVDVHLFEQAIESTHYKHAKEFFKTFLEGYKNFEQYEEVIIRLGEVRVRGRNKH